MKKNYSINLDRDDEECYSFWNDEGVLEVASEEQVLKSQYGIEKKDFYFKEFLLSKKIFRKVQEKYFDKSSQIIKFPFPAKVVQDSINDLLFFYSIDEDVDDLVYINGYDED